MQKREENEWKEMWDDESAHEVFKGGEGTKRLKEYLAEKGVKYIAPKERMIVRAVQIRMEEKEKD